MKHKLVAILCRNDLINEAILSVLAQKEALNIVQIEDFNALEKLLASVNPAKSDIVIIQQIGMGEAECAALELLQNYGNIKLIVISPENNVIDIYSKQEVMASQATDLVDLIEENTL